MRKFNIFIALAFLFTSCVVDDLQYIENGPRDIESGIKIFGTVQDFDVKKVTTRADEGSSELPSDSFISEMTMFVFKGDGELIQGYSSRTVTKYDDKNNAEEVEYVNSDECSSAINLQKANPTFLIDTQDGLIASLEGDNPTVIFYDHKAEDLAKCKIYIVANAWHALEPELDKIKTLADLEAITLDIDDNLSMPKKDDGSYRGFPMIGTHRKFANNEGADTFDLRKTGENKAGAVAKIPLKKLFSKVSFTIQVNANEVVNTPKFKLEKVEVFNVPSKARLGRELDSNGKPTYKNSEDYIVEMVGKNSDTTKDYYHFTEQPKELPNTSFSRTEISHTTQKKLTEGSEYLIEFGFYMPEHKVTPNYNSSTFTGYPDNIDEDFKQYYKPDLVEAVRNGDGTTTNGKNATFVRIHGKYTDHNGQIKNVRYDIYLGQNNTDDFTVKRNQLLTNKLVITGLTNYHDAYGDNQQNISVDHRVDVDYAGFNLSMERTAILDSHFEVRPLDIELSPGSTMTITIPEGYRDWVAMESDAAARAAYSSGKYVSNGERKAVRKYFTNNLVKELNNATTKTLTVEGVTITAKGPEISIEYNGTGSKIFRIWFYVDENPNVYDKTGAIAPNGGTDGYTVSKEMYRVCPVKFEYKGSKIDENGNTVDVTNDATINFQQWNLWRVWSAPNENGVRERYYDIEHEEEYLNNYASDQQYGGTQDGMPYGLEGIQLSHTHDAYYFDYSPNGILQWIIELLGWASYEKLVNKVFEGRNIKYDFYLPRDVEGNSQLEDAVYIAEYNGHNYNKEIVNTLLKLTNNDKIKLNKVVLSDNDLKSAIAYCYNKNRRDVDGNICTFNSDGTLNSTNLKWYLPSIDEMEDIARGAYDEFDGVFQKNYYWSCQPAFNPIYVDYNVYEWKVLRWDWADTGDNAQGYYYQDNDERARSTSVVSENGEFKNLTNSGSDIYANVTGNIYVAASRSKDPDNEHIENLNPSYDNYPGNKLRTEKCRIRAVYRSGTK